MKNFTCKLALLYRRKNLIYFLLHMSKQSSEEWGVVGRRWRSWRGGGVFFSRLSCLSVVQAARSLWNLVGGLSGLRLARRGKTVTEKKPLGDSASHACLWRQGRKTGQVPFLFLIQERGGECMGAREASSGWQSDFWGSFFNVSQDSEPDQKLPSQKQYYSDG